MPDDARAGYHAGKAYVREVACHHEPTRTDHIVEPGKCGGRPCIRGTRFRVMDLLELLAADASHEEILRDYAFLEPEDILAALLYAARQTDHVVLAGA